MSEEPKFDGIKVTGVSVKHNFKDDKGNRHKFTQWYRYIPLTCPVCKTIGEFLFPALNQCHKCHTPLAFCVLNDGDHHIGLYDMKKLVDELEDGRNNKETNGKDEAQNAGEVSVPDNKS
jgi:hypothetical protein